MFDVREMSCVLSSLAYFGKDAEWRDPVARPDGLVYGMPRFGKLLRVHPVKAAEYSLETNASTMQNSRPQEMGLSVKVIGNGHFGSGAVASDRFICKQDKCMIFYCLDADIFFFVCLRCSTTYRLKNIASRCAETIRLYSKVR